MLTWIAILLLGTIVGWLSAVIAGVDTGVDVLLWVVAGLGGAILGGALLTPWLGGGAIVVSGFSLPNLLLALLGAVAIPAVAIARRRRGNPGTAPRKAKTIRASR